jgi:hypothetical protein
VREALSAAHEPLDKLLEANGDLCQIASGLEQVGDALPQSINADPERADWELARFELAGRDLNLASGPRRPALRHRA